MKGYYALLRVFSLLPHLGACFLLWIAVQEREAGDASAPSLMIIGVCFIFLGSLSSVTFEKIHKMAEQVDRLTARIAQMELANLESNNAPTTPPAN